MAPASQPIPPPGHTTLFLVFLVPYPENLRKFGHATVSSPTEGFRAAPGIAWVGPPAA